LPHVLLFFFFSGEEKKNYNGTALAKQKSATPRLFVVRNPVGKGSRFYSDWVRAVIIRPVCRSKHNPSLLAKRRSSVSKFVRMPRRTSEIVVHLAVHQIETTSFDTYFVQRVALTALREHHPV
jgi:hypothetical protein